MESGSYTVNEDVATYSGNLILSNNQDYFGIGKVIQGGTRYLNIIKVQFVESTSNLTLPGATTFQWHYGVDISAEPD